MYNAFYPIFHMGNSASSNLVYKQVSQSAVTVTLRFGPQLSLVRHSVQNQIISKIIKIHLDGPFAREN